MSRTIGTLPGMQATSKIHDWMQMGFDRLAGEQDSWLRTIGNVPAMLPAAGAVGLGLTAGVPMGIYLTVDEAKERR